MVLHYVMWCHFIYNVAFITEQLCKEVLNNIEYVEIYFLPAILVLSHLVVCHLVI